MANAFGTHLAYTLYTLDFPLCIYISISPNINFRLLSVNKDFKYVYNKDSMHRGLCNVACSPLGGSSALLWENHNEFRGSRISAQLNRPAPVLFTNVKVSEVFRWRWTEKSGRSDECELRLSQCTTRYGRIKVRSNTPSGCKFVCFCVYPCITRSLFVIQGATPPISYDKNTAALKL